METSAARALLFDEELAGWEDWDFFIRASIEGYCGKRVPQALLAYRIHTGQRRERAEALRETLLTGFRDKYGHWFNTEEGNKKLMARGCCGGNADPILAAKGLLPDAHTASDGEAVVVVLRYTGDNAAPVTYYGTNRRTYQAGTMPGYDLITAPPADAERLLSTGRFVMA